MQFCIDNATCYERWRAVDLFPMKTTASVWAGAAALIGIVACGGSPGGGVEDAAGTEAAVTSGERPSDRSAGPEPGAGAETGCEDPPAAVCVGPGDACVTSEGDRLGCCETGDRCIEYTVYDHPRCLAPFAAGAYCYRDDQCSSFHCVASACAP
jgi:hypothetical protein